MLYFAYGSNLNLRHMKRHAPRAKPIGRARLDGYALVFRRFIDIAPETSGVVWGAVYEITPACERSLDSYEDFPALYRKIIVRVDVDGATHDAMAYTMNDDALNPQAKPADVLDVRFRAGCRLLHCRRAGLPRLESGSHAAHESADCGSARSEVAESSA